MLKGHVGSDYTIYNIIVYGIYPKIIYSILFDACWKKQCEIIIIVSTNSDRENNWFCVNYSFIPKSNLNIIRNVWI